MQSFRARSFSFYQWNQCLFGALQFAARAAAITFAVAFGIVFSVMFVGVLLQGGGLRDEVIAIPLYVASIITVFAFSAFFLAFVVSIFFRNGGPLIRKESYLYLGLAPLFASVALFFMLWPAFTWSNLAALAYSIAMLPLVRSPFERTWVQLDILLLSKRETFSVVPSDA